jgi:hypothetical protein
MELNLEQVKITDSKVKIRLQKELELLDLGLGPYQIARKMGISHMTVYRDFDALGEETKKELFTLGALVTEVERAYYQRRIRIMKQILTIEKMLVKKPGQESLIKSLVKLEYVLNRIDTDRIDNLQKLRVVPAKLELKRIHQTGGYVRIDDINETRKSQ